MVCRWITARTSPHPPYEVLMIGEETIIIPCYEEQLEDGARNEP